MSKTILDLHTDPSPGVAFAAVPRPRFRWYSRVVIPGLLVAGCLVVLLTAAWQAMAPATPVRVAQAVQKSVTGPIPGASLVQAAGWIEADPSVRYVPALTDGILDAVLVLPGDPVTSGQVVARLVDDEARLAVQRCEADVRVCEAAVAEAVAAKAAAATVCTEPVELERDVQVAEGDLAEAKALLEQQHAIRREAQATVDQARRTASRLRGLNAARVVSPAELEEAETDVAAGEASLDAAAKALAAIEGRVQRRTAERTAACRLLELNTEARRRRDETAAALTRTEAALAVAQVALREARLRLERHEVRAPMAGIVLQRFRDPGEKASLGGDDARSASLISIYDPERLQVRVDVPLADVGKVQVGQRCEVSCEVLSDRRLRGRVTRILHEADTQKNTLQVKVAIEDPCAELRPEMLARVRFLADSSGGTAAESAAVFVPSRALRDGAVWSVVGRDGKSGRVSRQSIEPGRVLDGWVEGARLNPGELVVIEADGPLREGRRVRVVGEVAE